MVASAPPFLHKLTLLTTLPQCQERHTLSVCDGEVLFRTVSFEYHYAVGVCFVLVELVGEAAGLVGAAVGGNGSPEANPLAEGTGGGRAGGL